MAPPDSLTISGLSVGYPAGRSMLLAVDDVSLSLHPGKIVAVVGESGCGKSTLARAVLSLPPGKIIAGAVEFEGTNLAALDEGALRRIRGRRISMIFQNPTSSLNPLLTIRRQLSDSYLAHWPRADREEVDGRVEDVMERLGISKLRLEAYPHELSGGMTQRVMIGMGLICGADYIIADEPTTSLDVLVEFGFMAFLHEMSRATNTGVMLVSHNIGLVGMWADYVAVMYCGRIVEYGVAATVLDDPQHPYTKALVGATPSLSRGIGELTRLPGVPANPASPPSGCAFHPRCPVADAVCSMRKPRITELARDGEPSHPVVCLRFEPDFVALSPARES
jgi:oligopeptide/dipeptide ABC transporter ATP-binding protein